MSALRNPNPIATAIVEAFGLNREDMWVTDIKVSSHADDVETLTVTYEVVSAIDGGSLPVQLAEIARTYRPVPIEEPVVDLVVFDDLSPDAEEALAPAPVVTP